MTKPSHDIRPAVLPDLKWDSGGVQESLKQVLAYAYAHADEAAGWYVVAKRSKRVWARLLRLGAILFTAAAGILPVVIQIFQTPDGKPPLAPAWASVLLGVALLFIAVDRFFGFSTAWMRYVAAELRVKQIREGFGLDSQTTIASLQGKPPAPDQVQSLLASVRVFIDKVDSIVVSETNQWVDEFREALKQVDESARTLQQPPQLGSIQVIVANGDATDSGWALALNGAPPISHTGKTAAIAGVYAGDHAICVTATADGKPIRGEGIASVKAGVIATVELTLD
jgi:hypothetical protein